MTTPRPCICTPDYRCASHYRIDPRLEALAKNWGITDPTWHRWLEATDTGLDASLDQITALLDDTTEGAS